MIFGFEPQGVGVISDTFQIPLTRSLRRFSSFPVGQDSGDRPASLRSFYGGEENQLVEVARQTLVSHRSNPKSFPYNPLLLCGGTGTGKSFLAHCFASLWLDAGQVVGSTSSTSNETRCRILLTTGADWARSFADAIRKDQVANWRATCRHASLFVLDDVQQLFRRDAAQSELLQLMDDFQSMDIPMILTSPSQPALLDRLDKRLVSRLSSGLVIDLQPPSLESRKGIVRELSKQQATPLTNEAIDWFTESYRGTVPVLQNMLYGALAHHASDHAPNLIDKPTLRRLIEKWESAKKVDLAEITRVVSRYTKVSQKQLAGPTRKQQVVQARSLAMYLANEIYGYSLREIGNHFGGRDHTTVLHACKKIHERALSDPLTKKAVEELRRILSAK